MEEHDRQGVLRSHAQGEVSVLPRFRCPSRERFESYAKRRYADGPFGFSSALSGTYGTVEQVAEDIRAQYPPSSYTIGKLASTQRAAHQPAQSRAHGRQLAEWAREARWFVNCLFTVDELEYLRRGGRIPAAAATIECQAQHRRCSTSTSDGALSLTGVARGRKKSLKALVKCL